MIALLLSVPASVSELLAISMIPAAVSVAASVEPTSGFQ